MPCVAGRVFKCIFCRETTLEWCPKRFSLVVHLFSACCCVSSSAKPPVSRFSLTGARARMSLQSLHWWNAFSQGPNIPLSFCAWLPLAGSSERRRRDVECFCCTVSHGFFMNVYISLPLPSWKSHLLVRKFVCAVLFQSHGSSHSLSCVITGIFVVNVWAFKKKKNLKTCIHHVVAGAHVGRFCLWV